MQTMKLGTEHLPSVLDFRLAMMEECGVGSLLAPDWRELTNGIYERMYANNLGVHFGVLEDGRLVACAGCMIKDDFPVPTLKHRRLGWIMDVYVLPVFRKRGLSSQLTKCVIDWLKDRGVTVIKLSASQQAKEMQLYERFGFEPTREMVLRIPVELNRIS